MADITQDLKQTILLQQDVALTLKSDSFALSKIEDLPTHRSRALDSCFRATIGIFAANRNPQDSEVFDTFSGMAPRVLSTIPYLDVLWAEVAHDHLTIDYVHRTGNSNGYKLKVLKLALGGTDPETAEIWVQKLLDHSYGSAKRQKRIKVLVNPFSGPGKGLKKYQGVVEPIFKAARCAVEMVETQHQGHAGEMMRNLDITAWDAVVCCSGDGLPHEVFNGLAKRPDAKHALASLAVVQLPCGSGNGMCCSILGTSNLSLATLYAVKGHLQSLDLVSVTQGQTRMLSFLSQNCGMIAECDLATEQLRFLGRYRFIVGFLQRLILQPRYPCDIALCVDATPSQESCMEKACPDDESNDIDFSQSPHQGLPPLRFGTISQPVPAGWEVFQHESLSIIYGGKLPYMDAGSKMFPRARIDDGHVDVVRVEADIPRTKKLRVFARIGDGSYVKNLEVDYRKVVAYRFVPRGKDGYISIDGEKIPFEAFQVEVHNGLGLTLRRPENAVADLP
ncbi:sphingosine kinase [Hyaloscypha variabilis F]|uniref:Sphingosine kinase n=1 Tax=Hyaloscypha variabilis (strain UAMH 11265 / GT02V1 / F) TaxID=1149755 RepID=A0A2J6S5P0_HYAVF|nr:sphingosine kinase [Hyaloscypha variabilis F]